MTTEEKTNKRGWVKNAAIIFLAVMLVLTLFSNTIMNASLPEVAQQTVQNGTISAKIRGSGTLESNGAYEVTLKQSYKVTGVNVRVGDTVEVGDTLFTLESGESTELSSVRKELDDARLQYQIDLVNAAASGDYTTEQKNIERAQKDLEDATADSRELLVTQEELNAAQAAIDEAEQGVENAKQSVKDAETRIDQAQERVDKQQEAVNEAKEKTDQYAADVGYSGGGGGSYAGLYASLESKQEELRATRIAYAAELEQLDALAREEAAKDMPLVTEDEVLRYMQAIAIRIDPTDTALAPLKEAYNAIKMLEDEIDSLNGQISDIIDSDMSSSNYASKKKYDEAKEAQKAEEKKLKDEEKALAREKKSLEEAEKAVTEAETKVTEKKKDLEDLKAKEKQYKESVRGLRDYEDKLDAANFALEEKIRESSKESQIDQLKLESQRKDIERLQARVAELEKEASGTEVKAPQAGVVTAVSVKTGSETSPSEALAVIEAPDLGYTMSFSVTNEQARRVTVGDEAEMSNTWWGPQLSATLKQIKPDPQNPRTNRLLVFEVKGEDLTAGTNVSLSIGQKSQNYDAVVPNSAVRTDNKGSFVLVVEAKTVPLGTRYTARRVDVNVLASDDTNTAIAGGGVSAWNTWVITSSSKPLEPGMNVRLTEK